MFNRGVSREGLLIDMGEEIGVVNRAGAWYSYGNDLRLGQGRENSKAFLCENPDIAEEIEALIREELGMSVSADSDDTETAKTAQAVVSGDA